jgi:hypothetical protein
MFFPHPQAGCAMKLAGRASHPGCSKNVRMNSCGKQAPFIWPVRTKSFEPEWVLRKTCKGEQQFPRIGRLSGGLFPGQAIGERGVFGLRPKFPVSVGQHAQ